MESTLLLALVLILWAISIMLFHRIEANRQDTALRQYNVERLEWMRERSELLNRLMAKDISTFQALQGLTNSPSVLDSTEAFVSMSDESEQERIASLIAEGRPVGEVLVSYEEEFRELGLLHE